MAALVGMAAHLERKPREHSAHAATDDRHVRYAVAARHPVLSGIAEETQILLKLRLEGGKSARINRGRVVRRHVVFCFSIAWPSGHAARRGQVR